MNSLSEDFYKISSSYSILTNFNLNTGLNEIDVAKQAIAFTRKELAKS